MDPNRKITIKRFPSIEGHSEVTCTLGELTPKQVFFSQGSVPSVVTVNGTPIKSWDDLLDEVNHIPEADPVEILQTAEMVGG